MVATGETHSVQEFCDIAFKHSGMELEWKGTGTDMVTTPRQTNSVKYLFA